MRGRCVNTPSREAGDERREGECGYLRAPMLSVVFGLLAAVVLTGARVLYRLPGAFNPERFPLTAAALGAPEPRMGAVYGAFDGVPVSVRVIDAAAAGASRDQVTVRAPAPGNIARLTLRSVPREMPDRAMRSLGVGEFPMVYSAEGHTADEIDALVPEDVRVALLALASPDGRAPTPAPSDRAAGYREDGRRDDDREFFARPVSLVVGDDGVALSFEARRVTDAQLLAAVHAVARCARRVMLHAVTSFES